MDNWDYFQENLATAYGSEGTLEEQAEIYATSWEAARDRVQASAEDIYDSLINPDFYIEADNVLSPILDRVADIVDGLGGLSGVLITLAPIMTRVFGDKIATSIRDMAVNLKIITNEEQERARELQKQTALLAERASLLNIDDEVAKQRVQLTEQEVKLRALVNEHLDELSTRQKQNLQFEQQRLQAIKDYAAELNKAAEKQQTLATNRQQTLLTETNPAENWQEILQEELNTIADSDSFNAATKAFRDSFNNIFKKNINDAISSGNFSSILSQITSELDSLAQKSAGIDIVTKAIENLGNKGALSEQQIIQLAIDLNLIGDTEFSTTNFEAFENKIINLKNDATAATEESKELASALNKIGANQSSIQKYVSSLNNLYKLLNEEKITVAEFGERMKELEQDLDNGKFAAKDFSESLVYLSQQISSVVAVSNGFSQFLDTLDDKDLSGVDKITQTLTSFSSFAIPLLNMIPGIAKSLSALGTAGATAAAGTGAAATGIAGIGTAITTALPIISGVAVVITLVAQAISHLTEKSKEARQAIRDAAYDAAESSAELAQSNQELLQTMSSALDTYAETQDNKSELDDATRTLADAFDIEGSALARLSGNYEDYNKVLQDAIDNNKDVLEQQRNDTRDARDAVGEEIAESLPDIISFKGWGGDEKEAAKILWGQLSDAFGEESSTGRWFDFKSFVNFSLPADATTEDYIKLYNVLKNVRQELNNVYTTEEEQANSGIISSIDTQIDALEDLIDQYNTYSETIAQLNLQLGYNGLSGEEVSTLEEYKTWVSQAEEEIYKLLPDADENEINTIITQTVDSFINPKISELKATYDAIQEILDLMPDASVNEGTFNWLADIFSSDTYDASVLASLNWATITKDNFEETANAAQAYADALQGVTDAQSLLEGSKSALEVFGNGDLSSDDITKIYEDIDWGNAEKGIMEFTDWLNSETWEQQAYLNKLISQSYNQIVKDAADVVTESKIIIEQNQKIIDNISDEELEAAYEIIRNWEKVKAAYEAYQTAVEENTLDDFDVNNWDIHWEYINDGAGWEQFIGQTSDEIKAAIETGAEDAEITVNKVEIAEEAIEEAQNNLEDAEFTIEVTAKDKFTYQIEQIKDSASSLISVFDAIADGVTITTDSMGNKFWAFSAEAVEAIDSVYNGFAANVVLLEDGTATLTDDMYQMFFNSSNGILQADAATMTGMMENQIAELEAKKDQATLALGIAQKLATGELTIDNLSLTEKKTLLQAYEDACEINNGNILSDEVDMLTTSDTNYSNFWSQVSDYSAQGAKNMADNVADATTPVLENLEKIRKAAYTVAEQISQIGTGVAVDLGTINTNVTPFSGSNHTGITTEEIGSWLSATVETNKEDYRNPQGKGKEILEEEEAALKEAEAAFASASKDVGAALVDYYNNEISQLDEAIGAYKLAEMKLLSSIDNAYDSAKSALDDSNKSSGSGSGSSSDNEGKTEDLKEFDEEAEKYHEINRQLEYYDYLINKIDEDISNATTVNEKLDLEAQEIELLNKQYELLNDKRKEAYNYVTQGKSSLQSKFNDIFATSDLSIQFDEQGEVLNAEELEKYLIGQVALATTAANDWIVNTYNKADKETQETLEDTLQNYEDTIDAAETVLEEFRDSLEDYEGDIDTYRDTLSELQSTVTSLTEAERQRYELNLEKLQELEDKFHSIEREDAHLDARRNLASNKIDIGGSEDKLIELLGNDASTIMEQAKNAQETYQKTWENIAAIRQKITEYWPDAEFSSSTGEITNYYELLERVRTKAEEAAQALADFKAQHEDDIETLSESEQEEYDNLIKEKSAVDALAGQFEKFANEYEEAMDDMIDAQQAFSDSILEMLENAEKAFDVLLEQFDDFELRLYRINRILNYTDFAQDLLDDAYDLATSDAERADIVLQQIENINKRIEQLNIKLQKQEQNAAQWRDFLKKEYSATFDENQEVATVTINNKIVDLLNNAHSVTEELNVLEDELAGYTDVNAAELNENAELLNEVISNYKEADQKTIKYLVDEIAKWRELQNALDKYSNELDDLLDIERELSSSQVEIKNKEEDLYELQKKKNEEEIEDLETINDRYHEINRQIERQERLLNKISTATDRAFGTAKLKNYTDSLEGLNKQLDNLISKLGENQTYLQADFNALSQFGTPEIDQTTGELLNRSELVSPAKTAYEDYYYNTYLPAVTALNERIKAGEDITDDEMTQYEELVDELDVLKKAYEDVTEAVEQYEESVDTREDIIEEWQDTIREIEDIKLQEITYKLEVVIQVKDMKRAADEFSQQIVESFGDALTHGLESADWSATMAQDEAALLTNYLQEYNELKEYLANAGGFIDEDGNYKYATDVSGAIDELEELQSKVISSGEYLLDWIDSLETLVPDAVSAAAERLAQFTDQLEHNDTVLSTIKELYTLQGVTYKTTEGFNRLQKVSQERYNAQLAEAKISKKWFDGIAQELAEAQAALDQTSEGSLQYDTLKANRDALLEQYNEAQEAYLSKAQEAMETAHDMYLEALEKASYDFSQAISGGIGLDLLQDKYDNYIDEEERYLDTVNELYEVNSWNLKLQTAIDDASTSAQKERLKALQEEIDLRRQGGTLSQYDLDILEAKYNLQLAQMALEDAQNAKNQARLVRDSQGNWNYQFYADDAQIADAQQQMLDAQNEYYNIAKQQVQDVTSEILSAWQECNDKIKEIYEDETLTVDEREAAIAEVRRHYAEIIEILEEEKNVAIGDMNTAALQSILYMTETGTASIIDMEGNAVPVVQEMSDETQAIIKQMEEQTGIDFNTMTEQAIALLIQMGVSSNDILDGMRIDANGRITGMSDDLITILAGMVSTSAEENDNWSNDFANTLDDMTQNTDVFDEMLDDYIDNMEENWDDYQDKVGDVADETGTSLEDLDDDVNQLAESTDNLADIGYSAEDSLLAQIDAAQDASWAYLDLADSIREAVDALEELARAQAQVGSDASQGIGVGTNVYTTPSLNLDTSGTSSSTSTPTSTPTTTTPTSTPITTPTTAEDYVTSYPDVDWSALMVMAAGSGYDSSVLNAIGDVRDAAADHWGVAGSDSWYSTSEVKEIINTGGSTEAEKEWLKNAENYNGPLANNSLTPEQTIALIEEIAANASYDTGGYTGEFDDGKLAFLHEKELVLNQEDTSNILSAVTAVRSLGPELFSQIEKILDGNAITAMTMLAGQIATIQQPISSGTIEQSVKIEASFPSVTDRNEIEEAFNSLVNDAAQYARIRKE